MIKQVDYYSKWLRYQGVFEDTEISSLNTPFNNCLLFLLWVDLGIKVCKLFDIDEQEAKKRANIFLDYRLKEETLHYYLITQTIPKYSGLPFPEKTYLVFVKSKYI